MSGPRTDHFIEIHVPDAETEQLFLLLAVEAAIKKYRERRRSGPLPAGPYELEVPVLPTA
jgi:hypothetical protein